MILAFSDITETTNKKEQQANKPDGLLMERKVDCTGGIFAVQGSGVQSRLQANHVVIVQSHCFTLLRFWAIETETPTARPPISWPKPEGDGTSEERHRAQRAARGAPRREAHDLY